MTMTPLSACLTVACASLCLLPVAQADNLRIGGTGAALGTMKLMATAFEQRHPEHHVTIMPSLGSKGGIKAVAAGAIELAVSSRPLSPDELSSGAVATPYGRTPLVLATASHNPHQALTSHDLVEAYAGRLTQWPDGTRLRLVMRPTGDADTEYLKARSPAMREAVGLAEQRKGMVLAITDQEAADHLEKLPGALGPLTLAQILSEKRALKPLRLDGVTPQVATLADGRYAMHKEMLFVTTAQPSAVVQSFMAFTRSAAGQALLTQTGHSLP